MKTTLWLLLIAVFSCFAYAQRDTVIVRPVPINDILQNPRMGITTFNRFNGKPPIPPLEWSERGPVDEIAAAADEARLSRHLDCLSPLVLERHRAGAGKIPLGHHRPRAARGARAWADVWRFA